MPTKEKQDKQEQQVKAEKFTGTDLLDYYYQRIAYWETKLPKLLSQKKIRHANGRIKHYTGKAEALKATLEA
jgi:hypothetical protein